jgi:hypothetical protein
MLSDILNLSIVRKDDVEHPTITYNAYAYSEGDAYQSGNFEFTLSRTSILNEFESLLPVIMRSSIWRGSEQKVEFKDYSVPLDDLTLLGNRIYASLDPTIAERVSSSATIHLFTDDTLIPWELMNDGESFICLNHPFGMSPITTKRISKRTRKIGIQLRFMLIVDPQENLPNARKESDKIISMIKHNPMTNDADIFEGKAATWSQVKSMLREESIDILHVAAHAQFNEKSTEDSGVLLRDGRLLRPADIYFDIKGNPPWLVFMNACESAKTRDLRLFKKYGELSSLADAFIGAGALSYIGTSNVINDSSASEIAIVFYNNLLSGSTVGESLRKAKATFFENNPNDLSWSAFKLYGNPLKKIELKDIVETIDEKVRRWHQETDSCDPMKCAYDLGIDVDEVMEILSRLCRKAR